MISLKSVNLMIRAASVRSDFEKVVLLPISFIFSVTELQTRVPGMNIDGILNFRSIPSDGSLTFLDFWEAVDDSIASEEFQQGM